MYDSFVTDLQVTFLLAEHIGCEKCLFSKELSIFPAVEDLWFKATIPSSLDGVATTPQRTDIGP